MKLIINADDFGLHPSVNESIRAGYEKRFLTSTTMLCNAPHAVEALALSIDTKIPTGLHLNLTMGKPLARLDKVDLLVDDEGYFRYSAIDFFRMFYEGKLTSSLSNQIETEFAAQFDFILSHSLVPTHYDSHQHVHMIPPLFELARLTAKKFKIFTCRFTDEKFYFSDIKAISSRAFLNKLKWVAVRSQLKKIEKSQIKSNQVYIGLLDVGLLDEKTILSKIKKYQKARFKTIEVGVHPSTTKVKLDDDYDYPGIENFIQSQDRPNEFAMLEKLKSLLESLDDVTLVSYKEI